MRQLCCLPASALEGPMIREGCDTQGVIRLMFWRRDKRILPVEKPRADLADKFYEQLHSYSFYCILTQLSYDYTSNFESLNDRVKGITGYNVFFETAVSIRGSDEGPYILSADRVYGYENGAKFSIDLEIPYRDLDKIAKILEKKSDNTLIGANVRFVKSINRSDDYEFTGLTLHKYLSVAPSNYHERSSSPDSIREQSERSYSR